jgi:hypothetical protein
MRSLLVLLIVFCPAIFAASVEPVPISEDVTIEEQSGDIPVAIDVANLQSQPEDVHARQSSGSNNRPFGGLLQPLNPSNFLNNLIPGRQTERRQIGEQCQYSSDCLAGTINSVCFNGTCLCNLGYRYTAATKACTAVDTCPSCTTDTCSSGTDLYCDGTCIRNLRSVSIKGIAEVGSVQLTSPNWPEDYPASSDTYYCVTASTGRRVNIQFNWIDLETNCGFACDYVRVYNGCVGKPSELLAFFHGDNTKARECVTSSCNQMLVHFHSNEDFGKKGDQRSGFMGKLHEATYDNDLCNKCNV